MGKDLQHQQHHPRALRNLAYCTRELKLEAQVDLDLSPHTTLSDAGRDYIHNCFSLPGVTLAKGHYLGISGIASGSTEPDIIDVYAVSSNSARCERSLMSSLTDGRV